MWFAKNGYVALAIDTMELSEVQNRYAFHHGTALQNRLWWWAAGFTPAGVECWNGIRAIDYLLSRPEVDPQRLAVTGISGGGAYTVYIAAADDRVRCAVPVSGFSDLKSLVSHKTINSHCDCIVPHNTYGWELTTILALIAPRPLLFCNSDRDDTFPMDSNRRVMARLRQIYQMYGKPEQVEEYVSHGGHAYQPDLRRAIFRWINAHGAVLPCSFCRFFASGSSSASIFRPRVTASDGAKDLRCAMPPHSPSAHSAGSIASSTLATLAASRGLRKSRSPAVSAKERTSVRLGRTPWRVFCLWWWTIR
jgi:dienelactone hydrolase